MVLWRLGSTWLDNGFGSEMGQGKRGGSAKMVSLMVFEFGSGYVWIVG